MHDDKSRAVYGIDIMIDAETMEPKLLEITFSPDCKRACDYYPTFYDEIFQTLFLETMSENMERIIWTWWCINIYNFIRRLHFTVLKL